jgi:predicted DNA-binding transcriptional regulator YafY
MRSSRLLAILILLQLRGRVTAHALAEEFEVSVRTIYRDMDALSAGGVPLYGDKGPGGGFQLLDGYRTKLTGLDRDEASAMLMAGMPGPAAALGIGEAAGRARNKLLAALPETSAARAGLLGERFHLDVSDWYQLTEPLPALAPLATAVFESRRIMFTYDSWTQTKNWLVDPLGLVLKGGEWYVVAEADAKRLTFKVSNIVGLAVLMENFERPARFELGLWWAESLARFEAELRPEIAKLRVSPAGLKRIAALGSFAARAVAQAGPPDRRGWRSLGLPIESGDHSALALLGCGPEFEVISPPSFRHRIAELATAIAKENAP